MLKRYAEYQAQFAEKQGNPEVMLAWNIIAETIHSGLNKLQIDEMVKFEYKRDIELKRFRDTGEFLISFRES